MSDMYIYIVCTIFPTCSSKEEKAFSHMKCDSDRLTNDAARQTMSGGDVEKKNIERWRKMDNIC